MAKIIIDTNEGTLVLRNGSKALSVPVDGPISETFLNQFSNIQIYPNVPEVLEGLVNQYFEIDIKDDKDEESEDTHAQSECHCNTTHNFDDSNAVDDYNRSLDWLNSCNGGHSAVDPTDFAETISQNADRKYAYLDTFKPKEYSIKGLYKKASGGDLVHVDADLEEVKNDGGLFVTRDIDGNYRSYKTENFVGKLYVLEK
jgi:hypothetical protein